MPDYVIPHIPFVSSLLFLGSLFVMHLRNDPDAAAREKAYKERRDYDVLETFEVDPSPEVTRFAADVGAEHFAFFLGDIAPGLTVVDVAASPFLQQLGWLVFMLCKYPAGSRWLWQTHTGPWVYDLVEQYDPLGRCITYAWGLSKMTFTFTFVYDAFPSLMEWTTDLSYDAYRYLRLNYWDYAKMCAAKVEERKLMLLDIQTAFEDQRLSIKEAAWAVQQLSIDLYTHRPGCDCTPISSDFSNAVMAANEKEKEPEDIHWIIRLLGDLWYFYYNRK